MNYAAHYNRLISRANGRVLTGYHERHHVLPRCMGGSDEPSNLVDLTPEEHYVAHQLLVKMYPNVRGLATATVRMARQCTGNKAYGWLRRRSGEAAKQRTLSQEQKAAIGNFWRGRKRSASNAEKIGAFWRGRPRSIEHQLKLNAARSLQPPPFAGKRHSLETRANITAAQQGKKRGPYKSRTADHAANIASALKGRHLSAAHRAAISLGLLGNTNRRYKDVMA